VPAKKRIKYSRHQVVEVGNGKKKKPLVGEILDIATRYDHHRVDVRGRYNRFERDTKSRVIQYNIHFYGEQSPRWVYQERILRAQPELSQDELEARAREVFGEDYV